MRGKNKKTLLSQLNETNKEIEVINERITYDNTLSDEEKEQLKILKTNYIKIKDDIENELNNRFKP